MEAANADYLSERIAGLELSSGEAAQDEVNDKVVMWAQEQLSKNAYVRTGKSRSERDFTC